MLWLQGIIYRFNFLILATLFCAAMTVAFFITSYVNDAQWDFGDGDDSHALNYTAGFLTGFFPDTYCYSLSSYSYMRLVFLFKGFMPCGTFMWRLYSSSLRHRTRTKRTTTEAVAVAATPSSLSTSKHAWTRTAASWPHSLRRSCRADRKQMERYI